MHNTVLCFENILTSVKLKIIKAPKKQINKQIELTLEDGQKEDFRVLTDFSLTVGLLDEFDHILVLIESNMNSTSD